MNIFKTPTLDNILGQFHAIEARLGQFLDWAADQQTRNSYDKSIYQAQITELDELNLDLSQQMQRAISTRDKIRDLCSL